MTTYKPTLMEKLLGRNYKWWFFIKYRIKRRFAYRLNNLFFAIGQFLTLVSTVTVWFLATDGFSETLQERLTYFIFGTLFYSLVYHWPSFELGLEIRNGQISSALIRPHNFFVYYWFKSYFYALVQGFTVILGILITLPIWNSWVSWPTDWTLLLPLIFALPIDVSINFFTEMLVGTFAFWSTEIEGVVINYGLFTNFLSGRLFPLSLIITSFGLNLLNFFAFLFYHPMQILLSKYDNMEILLVFVSGLGWSIFLAWLATAIFQKWLKRNESVGL